MQRSSSFDITGRIDASHPAFIHEAELWRREMVFLNHDQPLAVQFGLRASRRAQGVGQRKERTFSALGGICAKSCIEVHICGTMSYSVRLGLG